jgi:mono/diheme cytochrome c family protein
MIPRSGACAALLALASCGPQSDPNMSTFSQRRSADPEVARFHWLPDTVPVGASTPASAPLDDAALARGQEGFVVYCAPCHGADGRGQGIIVRHGFPAPPSLLESRLRAAGDDHLLSVLERGLGVMPSYADLVRPEDRAPIIAYIRTLQIADERRSASGAPTARPMGAHP